jgi:heat shock 70kDa protein 4
MVAFDQARKMGETAGMGAVSQYKNTIYNMKRLVGLAWDDPIAQAEMKKCPFTCVPIEHKETGCPTTIGVKVTFHDEETVVSIEAVTGMIIKHMGMIAAEKAAQATGGNTDQVAVEQLFPQDWVIAIPSYFTDAQRRAFLTGCEIAGVSGIQRLMHESTAVALAYGIFKDIKKEFEKDKPTHVMFIDIGASQYTVSIVAYEPGKLIVKTSYCDPNLGGRDFDEVIAGWLADKFVEKYKSKLSGNPRDKPKVWLKLLTAAEKAKKTLSPYGVKEASVNLECLMDDLDFHIMFKASDYEALMAPFLARLEEPIKKALEEAKLAPTDLASVEIVGGSTRINSLKQKLKDTLGCELSTTMNADEAVARGAALQSAILSPRFKVLPYEIVECNSLPINISWDGDNGMEVEGGAEAEPTNSVVMFDRALNFPITRRVTLKRAGPFTVKAAYDTSASQYGLAATSSSDISTFTIQAPDGEEKKVRVNVKQDIHGIISLSSAQMVEEVEEEEAAPPAEAKEGEEAPKEPEEKKKKVKRTNLDFTMSRPIEWSKEEIQRANEQEVSMANTDRVVRETADMRNELESYIYDMRDKIISDSQLAPYITEDEKAKFNTKQEEIENWLYEDGFDATKSVYAEKLAELKTLGGPSELRASEAAARPNAVASLQKNVEKYKTWFNDIQGNEDYAHITEEEISKCHAKCDEISSWVYDMLDKQGSLPLNVDPVVKVDEINAKSQELTSTCSPIMHKPKPKPEPKKEEEKPKEEAPPAPEAAAEEAKPAEPEPMETEEAAAPAEEEGDKMETE